MPKLIKLHQGQASLANDRFTQVADEEPLPGGDVIISLTRFQAEGDRLLSEGRAVGVRVEAGEEIEGLVYDLPRVAVVALAFPKFRDGRHYTNARLLRERFDYRGEVRAVGDVLREQAMFMVRCGFDAFEPADDSGPDEWLAATRRFTHVYQRAADTREPAFVARAE